VKEIPLARFRILHRLELHIFGSAGIFLTFSDKAEHEITRLQLELFQSVRTFETLRFNEVAFIWLFCRPVALGQQVSQVHPWSRETLTHRFWWLASSNRLSIGEILSRYELLATGLKPRLFGVSFTIESLGGIFCTCVYNARIC